ncbi:MAG: 2,3-bisphosphoglycerate-independent phosphoglycerate mutase [Gaiellales bacterium]|jgi:2,3-bisphosphoglycerate-independent phosphoglycerate mutase|nr:2,3-bisphosphoglycerate-independent phosphoglycerate mutase [Gaiellales bacterium]
MSRGPVALVILDGLGLAPAGPGNAVSLAQLPVFDELWASMPHTTLAASGADVGLPDGQMGNSEVGHLNLGAGRIVPQTLVRIGNAVADGTLASNPAFLRACDAAKAGRGVLHLAGLVSDGGVHSHVDHLRALVRAAVARNVPRVAVHAFTDGRDVSPHQAADLLAALEREWEGTPAEFSTVVGRFYAMDRDGRTERTERARAAMVEGLGQRAPAADVAVRADYGRAITDEFVDPIVLGGPALRVQQGDPLFTFNFRPDRMRQLCHALVGTVGLLATMTRYDGSLPGPVAFDDSTLSEVLAEVVARAGLAQLHVAETEKYPHVTYFFNGRRELPWPREERLLAPSRRDVPTYDLAPEMRAREVSKDFAERFGTGDFAFGVVNLANPDMVGHTGVIPAVVRACEAADAALATILRAVRDVGGTAIVTADHGNAERMLEEDGSPHTAHTTNLVPLIVTDPDVTLRPRGRLADVAPTVLALLGLSQPAEMTGVSLL